MSLLHVFEWFEATSVGAMIRQSTWMFPVIEAMHLLALALIGGAVLVVDLRLFGWGLRRMSVRQLASDAQPWMVGSLIMMIITGVLLMLSEAIKCYYNVAFWWKMGFLAVAIIYTFTVRRRVIAMDDGRLGPLGARVAAAASVILWSGVGISGRAIGFY